MLKLTNFNRFIIDYCKENYQRKYQYLRIKLSANVGNAIFNGKVRGQALALKKVGGLSLPPLPPLRFRRLCHTHKFKLVTEWTRQSNYSIDVVVVVNFDKTSKRFLSVTFIVRPDYSTEKKTEKKHISVVTVIFQVNVSRSVEFLDVIGIKCLCGQSSFLTTVLKSHSLALIISSCTHWLLVEGTSPLTPRVSDAIYPPRK